MQVRPVTPERLVEELAGRVLAAAAELERAHGPRAWLRVAVDGAPAARPADLADALVDPVRVGGRAALRVSAEDFLRPASLRLERGREDPDAYLEDRLDDRALAREVLDPLDPGGTGRWLPSLWDAQRDRATRAAYAQAPPGAVLLLDGTALLGRWLALDLVVHLALGPGALARRTPPQLRWTLPALERYGAEVLPEEVADVVVRVDDPRRPALVE
ncbi:uridine kinase [Vallicoccus soli]|uniref:Uridine kinase n=1 Tax=Vallicoccus soli TaxID=2339232 RepID=A0A3A3YZT8_9ACTN|nr:uridine kinase [Vallicoccus soli]RJK96341.1 uridine kinase [Vallicoccus soli]